MIFKSTRVQGVALALSLAALSLGSGLSAAPQISDNTLLAKDSVHQFVKPAQIFLEGTSVITPVLGQPIHFQKIALKENVESKKDKSVFKIEVPGLYEITSFLLVNPPTLDDSVSVTVGILINGKVLKNLIDSDVVPDDTLPIVTTRKIYLKKGDTVSVALIAAPTDTTISNRGLHFVALNNTRD